MYRNVKGQTKFQSTLTHWMDLVPTLTVWKRISWSIFYKSRIPGMSEKTLMSWNDNFMPSSVSMTRYPVRIDTPSFWSTSFCPSTGYTHSSSLWKPVFEILDHGSSDGDDIRTSVYTFKFRTQSDPGVHWCTRLRDSYVQRVYRTNSLFGPSQFGHAKTTTKNDVVLERDALLCHSRNIRFVV